MTVAELANGDGMADQLDDERAPTTWEYRVVSFTREDPLGHSEQSYELIEAYYRNRDDTDIVMWSAPEDTRPQGDTLLDLRADLERMLAACDKPVLIEEELPDA